MALAFDWHALSQTVHNCSQLFLECTEASFKKSKWKGVQQRKMSVDGLSLTKPSSTLKGSSGKYMNVSQKSCDNKWFLGFSGVKNHQNFFQLFGDFWPHWTLRTIPNILPRCDKTSETHSYISQTIPLMCVLEESEWCLEEKLLNQFAKY